MKSSKNVIKMIVALVVAMVCLFAVANAADNDVELKLQINNPVMTVNGAEAEIDPGRGTVPVVVEGRTLVPIRAIIEALGGTVGWDGEKSEVTLTVGTDEIKLVIDSKTAYLNGEKTVLDVAPTTINDRTMLPIRYVAESFNFTVGWEEATSTVTVTKKAGVGVDLEIFDDEDRFGITDEKEEEVQTPFDGERIVDDGYDEANRKAEEERLQQEEEESEYFE